MSPKDIAFRIQAKFQFWKERFKRKRTVEKVLKQWEEEDNLSASELAVLQALKTVRKDLDKSDADAESLKRVEDLRNSLLNNPTRMHSLPDSEGRVQNYTVAEICRLAATPPKWGAFLHQILRNFQPKECLELGTSIGISGAFQASALRLNGFGKLATIEANPAIADIARKTIGNIKFDAVRVITGWFSDVLPEVLDPGKQIDFVFIDGHHDEQATLEYFNQIQPYFTKQSIVIFDDINWSEGMQRFWKNFQNTPDIELFLDTYRWGIVCFRRGFKGKPKHLKVIR